MTAASPSGMGGRDSLSKMPSKEPPRASKNQTTRTTTARFLTLWMGRVLSAYAMMLLSFRVALANGVRWLMRHHKLACATIGPRKTAESAVRLRPTQLLGRFVEQ